MSQLDRRTALGLGAAAAGAAALSGAPAFAARATRRRLDPAIPADASAIYRKLRYRTDDGLIFSWIKGPYMAVIDGDMIPMYAINLGSIARVTQRPDGGFDQRGLEISFRVDVETGKRIERFANPVTKETVNVVVRPQGPNVARYSPANDVQLDPQPGGTRFDIRHHAAQPFRLDDEIYIRDRSHADVTAPDGTVSRLNEMSTVSAPASQVLDPATTIVYSRVQSNDVRSWPAWLMMGDRPGMLSLFANGGKVRRFEDLPQDWLEMLEGYAPAVLRDPIAALDRGAGLPGG